MPVSSALLKFDQRKIKIRENKMVRSKSFISVFIISITFFITSETFAHCDSRKGPVVKAAQQSLQTGNLNHVLIWIGEDDEKEISDLFHKVLKVRNLNDDAGELADNYFFETVVRVHRMGEGVAYTGLKPAHYKPEPGIEAADIAIEESSINKILSHVDEEHHPSIKKYFDEVLSKKNFDPDDVNAGREYVTSYVHFIHYIENIFGGEKEGHHHH